MVQKRRLVASVSVYFILSAIQISAQEPNNDFRNAKWGMTVEQVKKTETSTFYKNEPNLYMYVDTIAGLECIIGYEFNPTDGRLVSGFLRWRLGENYAASQERIVSALDSKFGTPYFTDVRDFSKPMYKNSQKDSVSVWIGDTTIVLYPIEESVLRPFVVEAHFDSVEAIKQKMHDAEKSQHDAKMNAAKAVEQAAEQAISDASRL